MRFLIVPTVVTGESIADAPFDDASFDTMMQFNRAIAVGADDSGRGGKPH